MQLQATCAQESCEEDQSPGSATKQKKEEINRAQGAKGAKGRNKLNSSRLCHCRFNFRLNFALHFASSQFSLEKILSKKGQKRTKKKQRTEGNANTKVYKQNKTNIHSM